MNIRTCTPSLVTALVTTGLVAAPLMAGTLAAADGLYDGKWSVSIVAQQGGCSDALNYPVQIKNSTLSNTSDAPFVVSGKIAEAGSVSLAIVYGPNSATASGRLSTKRGRGTWKSASCSGYWTAERAPPGD